VPEPKRLRQQALPRALEKAVRYRLLNEPHEAESICLDILAVEPGHQGALVVLLLALSDQFPASLGECDRRAREVLPQLESEYERAYYAGILAERRGKVELRRSGPGSGHIAWHSFSEAMHWYERAEELRPPDNDDALLRYNTCVRLLERYPSLQPESEERQELPLE